MDDGISNGESGSGARAANFREIPVDLIDTNPYQPRTVFNEVALQELVASILEHGVLQPIIVRPNGDRYQLVSGERRFQAARRAGLKIIPAILQHYDDLRMLEIAIVENVQREDISPLEAAEAYKRLMDEFSLTQEQVALRVGKSRPAVANTLRLLKLPSPIRESLARGDITEGHARSLLRITDPDWQERVWRRIVQDNLTVRDAENMAGAAQSNSDTASYFALEPPAEETEESDNDRSVSRETDAHRERGRSPERPRERKRERLDPNLAAVEDRLRLLLGTRVRIKGSPTIGSITIDYFSADDLQRIASLLGLV